MACFVLRNKRSLSRTEHPYPMKLPTLLLALPALLLFNNSTAQVKHAHTITVEVDGNCGLCQKTIESAAFVKGEATADRDRNTKIATITYDSTRTDLDAVLKRIALAGYDNQSYLAPADAYAALPGCCQYDRNRKEPALNAEAMADAPHAEMEAAVEQTSQEQTDPLDPVFSSYFGLKDALVASDAVAASTHAKAMAKAIADVKPDALPHEVNTAWKSVMKPMAEQATAIANAKDINAQRKAFAVLSERMEELLTASPRATPVYVAHCPMYEGGADWLSLEKPIKNPFYGNKMLTCGKVTETIVK